MNMQLFRFSNLRHAALTLATILALNGSSAFCGEIHRAAEAGDLPRVKALLKDSPSLINSKDDPYGRTPLHVAAQEGHKDVAELLLASHADVNAKDNDGGTPLHGAAHYGHKDVAELLLANKAQVNAKSDPGATALHVAATEGHKDIVELLLANHADVNAKDNGGHTPLAWAVHLGHTDVAVLLRQQGGHE